jgi:ABC-type transport system involved in multi-copper enzyme maturation permease subunit
MSTAWTIARTTIGDAFRKKIIKAFFIAALVLILISLLFSYFSPREELTIIKSFSFAVIFVFGILITIIMSISLIPGEIDSRTIYTVLSKPVRKWEYIVGKFVGAILTILISLLIMGFVFTAIVYGKSGAFELALFEGVFSVFLSLLVLCSIGVCLSVIVSPFLNFLLTFFILAVGGLSDTIYEISVSTHNEFIRFILNIVQMIVPNFGFFHVQNRLIHPEAPVATGFVEWKYLIEITLYALVYVVVLMLGAVYVFEKREV